MMSEIDGDDRNAARIKESEWAEMVALRKIMENDLAARRKDIFENGPTGMPDPDHYRSPSPVGSRFRNDPLMNELLQEAVASLVKDKASKSDEADR